MTLCLCVVVHDCMCVNVCVLFLFCCLFVFVLFYSGLFGSFYWPVCFLKREKEGMELDG